MLEEQDALPFEKCEFEIRLSSPFRSGTNDGSQPGASGGGGRLGGEGGAAGVDALHKQRLVFEQDEKAVDCDKQTV